MPFKINLAGLVVIAVCSTACADELPSSAECGALDKSARQNDSMIDPVSAFAVTGKGRFYLYAAPDEKCITKVFVIPGDSLIGYSTYKGFHNIMYMNPKTGADFSGWVLSDRLKFTGTLAPSDSD